MGWGDDETLVVVSSDLSHYHSYMETQLFDHQTTAMIEHVDEHLSDLNSGDAVCTTTGDKDSVVEYGAYAIY